jgi:phenylalanyl-tRNA synthetase beta subunit
MEDMLYYEYGTLAVCIELSTSKHNKAYHRENPISFWQNNPHDIAFWVENDRDAALSAIEEAFRINGGNPVPPR